MLITHHNTGYYFFKQCSIRKYRAVYAIVLGKGAKYLSTVFFFSSTSSFFAFGFLLIFQNVKHVCIHKGKNQEREKYI
jgi:hypothetical protein